MSNEIQGDFPTGQSIYFNLYNATSGFIWDNTTGFASYSSLSGNLLNRANNLTELGTASQHYAGNMPSGVPAGSLNVTAKQKLNAFYSESDPIVGNGTIEWDGFVVVPLASRASSGQVGQNAPTMLARSWQTLNWPIYLKSAADHVTPFTSGVVSGQISRDGGAFGPLQSGAFTELGNGFYALQALTSGDLNAQTVAMLFTAVNNVGASDPLPQAFRLQRISGQN
jgi:hypothetical protein